MGALFRELLHGRPFHEMLGLVAADSPKTGSDLAIGAGDYQPAGVS